MFDRTSLLCFLVWPCDISKVNPDKNYLHIAVTGPNTDRKRKYGTSAREVQ